MNRKIILTVFYLIFLTAVKSYAQTSDSPFSPWEEEGLLNEFIEDNTEEYADTLLILAQKLNGQWISLKENPETGFPEEWVSELAPAQYSLL